MRKHGHDLHCLAPLRGPRNRCSSGTRGGAGSGQAPILIVEDNRAVAELIQEILSEHGECQIASNGRAGLALLPTFRPELILTDEMMPVMSGMEMCRRIKAMPAFASIPIIMVTAREDNETETQAARLGIDTFLSKPFEAPLLRALVKQRLQAKNAVRESLRIEQITSVAPIVAESGNERLLDLVTRTIEEHIDDTELNVKSLCEKTGIGNKQLCRLIKKYAGVTPVEYIRQIRMKQAVVLLSQHKFTIAEIAYMVGFEPRRILPNVLLPNTAVNRVNIRILLINRLLCKHITNGTVSRMLHDLSFLCETGSFGFGNFVMTAGMIIGSSDLLTNLSKSHEV